MDNIEKLIRQYLPTKGKTDHRAYRLKPRLFVLFDEENFSSDVSRKEWRPSA